MAITTEQWDEIKQQFSGLVGRVELTLDEHRIVLKRQQVSENQLAIVVYIDGFVRGKWNAENFPIIRQVWHLKKSRGVEFYAPVFESFAALKKTYAKLTDIEVVCIGYVSTLERLPEHSTQSVGTISPDVETCEVSETWQVLEQGVCDVS